MMRVQNLFIGPVGALLIVGTACQSTPKVSDRHDPLASAHVETIMSFQQGAAAGGVPAIVELREVLVESPFTMGEGADAVSFQSGITLSVRLLAGASSLGLRVGDVFEVKGLVSSAACGTAADNSFICLEPSFTFDELGGESPGERYQVLLGSGTDWTWMAARKVGPGLDPDSLLREITDVLP